MRRYITTVFLGLGLCRAALGGPGSYYNYGVVTNPPVVDALVFLNTGTFEVDTLSGHLSGSLPFLTKDTLYYTNSGLMWGEPGFQFDTGGSTSRRSARSFFNSGTVEGIDTEAPIFLYAVIGGDTFVSSPAECQPIASRVLVRATNIVNTGVISVGNCGLLSLVGNNVTNAHATLTAGVVSTAGLIPNSLDITGLQGQSDWMVPSAQSVSSGQYFFDNTREHQQSQCSRRTG